MNFSKKYLRHPHPPRWCRGDALADVRIVCFLTEEYVPSQLKDKIFQVLSWSRPTTHHNNITTKQSLIWREFPSEFWSRLARLSWCLLTNKQAKIRGIFLKFKIWRHLLIIDWLIRFYSISTFVGYLMLNYDFTCIRYMICKLIVWSIFKRSWAYVFAYF